MLHKIIVAFALFLSPMTSFSEEVPGSKKVVYKKSKYHELKKKMLSAASKAVKKYLKGDFYHFTEYVHPKLVEGFGGREKMAQFLINGTKKMEREGYVIKKMQFGKPLKLYVLKSGLYCLIPEKMFMQIKGKNQQVHGTLITNAYMLGISTNWGESWSFVSVNLDNISKMEQAFPEFAKHAKIPEMSFPKFIPAKSDNIKKK